MRSWGHGDFFYKEIVNTPLYWTLYELENHSIESFFTTNHQVIGKNLMTWLFFNLSKCHFSGKKRRLPWWPRWSRAFFGLTKKVISGLLRSSCQQRSKGFTNHLHAYVTCYFIQVMTHQPPSWCLTKFTGS